MPNLSVKNVPRELHEQLKKSAFLHHRSVNRELIFCLERFLMTTRRNVGEILKQARALRKKTARHPLTDKMLSQFKNEGRA